MELSAFLKEWRSETPYIVAHTSGSTGKPKEIHLQKTDMEESARMTADFSVLMLHRTCISLCRWII